MITQKKQDGEEREADENTEEAGGEEMEADDNTEEAGWGRKGG